MNEIVLSADQASVLFSAEGPVVIRRSDGSFVGWVSRSNFVIPKECPFAPEEVAAAESQVVAPGDWITTEGVLERLRTLP